MRMLQTGEPSVTSSGLGTGLTERACLSERSF